LVATAANVALWALAQAMDVSLWVDPLVGDPAATRVGIGQVVFGTLFAFALGSALLALVARRSRLWMRIVIIAGIVVAVISIAGPLLAARDAAGGALLAAMHLSAGAAFVATSVRMGPP
jgi:uncharacterized membrane protein